MRPCGDRRDVADAEAAGDEAVSGGDEDGGVVVLMVGAPDEAIANSSTG